MRRTWTEFFFEVATMLLALNLLLLPLCKIVGVPYILTIVLCGVMGWNWHKATRILFPWFYVMTDEIKKEEDKNNDRS